MTRLRGRLTYSNVIATLALFVALGGGAYAATQLKKNSVGTKQLKNGAVTQKKISGSAQKALRGQTGPVGPAGPSGIGPAFRASFLNEVEITSQSTSSPTTVVTLAGLPAGAYAITAKTVLVGESFTESQLAECRLIAPADGGGSGTDAAFAMLGRKEVGDSNAAPMSMQLTHTFNADGGTARVACYHASTTAVEAKDTSIQAIRVTSISEVRVG